MILKALSLFLFFVVIQPLTFGSLEMNLDKNPLYKLRGALKKSEAWFLVEVPGNTNEKFEYQCKPDLNS